MSEMKLHQKGSIAPPPELPDPLESISQEIQTWNGIVAATHWELGRPGIVNGADFYMGEHELCHVHLSGEVHMLTTSGLRQEFITNGDAKPLPWHGYDLWVSIDVDSQAQAKKAIKLIRKTYDAKTTATGAEQ